MSPLIDIELTRSVSECGISAKVMRMVNRVLCSVENSSFWVRRSALSASLLLAGFAATACGNPDDGGGAGTSTSPTVVSPPPPEEVLTPGPETFVKIIGCFGAGDGKAIATCEDDFVARYAEDTGVEPLAMLDDLEQARALDPTMEAACHPISHAVGRWVYQNYPNIVDAFEQCNEACHSGCYHGVMERVFGGETDHPQLADVQAKMPTICDQSLFPTPALEFQCLHGVGHAVMYSLQYNLNLALDTCNLLPNPTGPGSCQSAVFMENINAAIPELRDLKKDDPHYPCNAVDPKYAGTCYGMQTSVMFGYIGMTVAEVANACLTGAGANTSTCFSSLGRDLSSWARTGQSENLRQPCEDLAGQYASSCVWGGIAALMDNTWDGSFAIPFCNYLHGDELRKTCYRQTHSHLTNAYLYDNDAWLEQCALFAGEHKDICDAQGTPPATP